MPQADGESSTPADELRAWLQDHGDRLLRSAYLLCGDAAEAEDLVQETFVQAFKAHRQFRGDSAVYTWLHGILLNLTRHYWRRRNRYVLDDSAALKLAAPPQPDSETDREYQASRLVQALQALSGEHREVIVLRYYEDLPLHEIAVRTGASPGTVKSRLHYAVRALEKILPDEMNLFAAQGTHNDDPP